MNIYLFFKIGGVYNLFPIMNRNAFILAVILMFGFPSCQKPVEKNKTLRVNISREPTCLDPRKVFDPSHQMLMSMLFEGLFKLELDLSVSPAQAKSFEISEDGHTYTFHLGEHVWSDQSAVTADDFVQTYLDILNPAFPAPHSNLLYDVLNAEEAKKGLVPLSEVGIRALDARTIQIQLKHTNPCFLQILASPYLVPVCRKQEESNPNWAITSGAAFVCNGPFTLSFWAPQTEIVLKRNRKYSGKYPAKINEIQITLIANEMSALNMYGSGCLDILGTPFSQIPLPFLKDLKAKKSIAINPVSATLFVGFNTQAAPFNNVHFRRAFALASNRREIIDHITLLDEEPALSLIPPILKKRPSPHWTQDDDVEGGQKELRLAMKDLSEKDLKDLTLYFFPLEINYLIAQTLQQQWQKNLGIEVKIQVIDFKTLLAKIADGSYKMAIFIWSADYADPISLLHRFRNSKDVANYARWENKDFSALLDASAVETNSEKRFAILEEAERLLVEEMPIAPIFHWNFSLLIQPQVKGVAMDPLGNIRFDQISIHR